MMPGKEKVEHYSITSIIYAQSLSSWSESSSDSSAMRNFRRSKIAATDCEPAHTTSVEVSDVYHMHISRNYRLLDLPNPPRLLPLRFFSSCAAACSSTDTRRSLPPPILMALSRLSLPVGFLASGSGALRRAPPAPCLMASRKLGRAGALVCAHHHASMQNNKLDLETKSTT